MRAGGLLDYKLVKWDTDPEFILEGVLLAVNERICEVMDKKGITRAELAKRLGKSRAYVTKLLNGQPNVTLKTLTQIAVALGEGIDVFVPSSVSEERRRTEVIHRQREGTWQGVPQRARTGQGGIRAHFRASRARSGTGSLPADDGRLVSGASSWLKLVRICGHDRYRLRHDDEENGKRTSDEHNVDVAAAA